MSAEMGRSRHVVIHDVIHDMERNGQREWQRPVSYRDVARPCACARMCRAYIRQLAHYSLIVVLHLGYSLAAET